MKHILVSAAVLFSSTTAFAEGSGMSRAGDPVSTDTLTNISTSTATGTAVWGVADPILGGPVGEVVVPVRFHARGFEDCVRKLTHGLQEIGGEVIAFGGTSNREGVLLLCRRSFPENGTLGGCTLPSFCTPTNDSSCEMIATGMSNVTKEQCDAQCTSHGKPATSCVWAPYQFGGGMWNFANSQSQCSITMQAANGMGEGQITEGITESACNALCTHARQEGHVTSCSWRSPGEMDQLRNLDPVPATGVLPVPVQGGISAGGG